MNERVIAPVSTGHARSTAITATTERYLTLRDLCERLQCSRTTAWRLVNERGLRTVRCGGLVRVRETDLLAWIEKHSTGNDSGEDART